MDKLGSVAIIDYGMGNLRSVLRAWEAAGADARIIDSPKQINGNDILVFPGQGCVVDTMKLLKATSFDIAIKDWIAADKPFFGICLGLQALFEYSEEGGGVECLGVFKGSVKKLRLPAQFKVPHMGWDNVEFTKDKSPALLEGISPSDQFYFVHSNLRHYGIRRAEVCKRDTQGSPCRHAIPPRKEPSQRAAALPQFFETRNSRALTTRQKDALWKIPTPKKQ